MLRAPASTALLTERIDRMRRRLVQVGLTAPLLSTLPIAAAGGSLATSGRAQADATDSDRAPRSADHKEQPRIGLALGSGGARGLSHIVIFEVLESLGLQPHRISGCSIGAIMGALYAAGLPAEKIRKEIKELVVDPEEGWFTSVVRADWRKWLSFLELSGRDGGLVESDAFVDHLRKISGVKDFADLKIPLQIVATDYWEREMVLFEQEGPLWPAVQASMAMPSLFSPVEHNGKVLVDGGLTNPLPYDLLFDDCDLIIAVNVLGTRKQKGDKALQNPSYFENIFNTFQVMQYSILREKERRKAPDFLVSPQVSDIRVLDFHRFEDILKQAQPCADALRADLEKALG
ncbi:patatin [Halorhodospira abdelmalekii]|uniref:patatin-like phospholipase family protein n=1 Tax=Halorhodospira abdelmalekii TaxID=421629 RepID=UPI001906C659|nr:patatin-like phospholipase family protein [Halorhodospira abdelmalekii]MBK1734590.1 patatin [Halorhodospira abdelmalekii]